jgi:hypothetical protein
MEPIECRPGEAPSEQLLKSISDQIVVPILTSARKADVNDSNLRYSALAEAFGIEHYPADTKAHVVKKACERELRSRLLRNGVLDVAALFEFAKQTLSKLDLILSRGAQAAPPNLFILIDQFEELFGEKVPLADRKAFVSLIIKVYKGEASPWLHLAVTMRSEELHRCSEHKGLAKVITNSLYLVDLIEADDLESAIVGPAQSVLRAWRLPYSRPFTPAAISLLKHAYREGERSVFSADQLPLMQHLLPLVWDRAIERWNDGAGSDSLTIDVRDIQAVPGWTDREGALKGCLRAHADRIWQQAVRTGVDTLMKSMGAQSAAVLDDANKADVEALVRVAFCALARRDDRGNPKRAFASLETMLTNSGVAAREGELQPKSRSALSGALAEFKRANLIGVLIDAGVEKYNVNHEAFIRGWGTYGEWLLHARRCEDRLIFVDQKSREAKSKDYVPNIFDLLMARRLEWAHANVSDETARLLDDVLGNRSTFSRAWAKECLREAEKIEQGS